MYVGGQSSQRHPRRSGEPGEPVEAAEESGAHRVQEKRRLPRGREGPVGLLGAAPGPEDEIVLRLSFALAPLVHASVMPKVKNALALLKHLADVDPHLEPSIPGALGSA